MRANRIATRRAMPSHAPTTMEAGQAHQNYRKHVGIHSDSFSKLLVYSNCLFDKMCTCVRIQTHTHTWKTKYNMKFLTRSTFPVATFVWRKSPRNPRPTRPLRSLLWPPRTYAKNGHIVGASSIGKIIAKIRFRERKNNRLASPKFLPTSLRYGKNFRFVE